MAIACRVREVRMTCGVPRSGRHGRTRSRGHILPSMNGAKVRLVSDVMTSDVLTASPSETIADATARMRDRKVGSVVVVDGSRPVGILTERDLVKITADGTDTAIAKVSEWMTENPDTVTPDVEVDDAFHQLT